MEYKTMTRLQVAMNLEMSIATLNRRIKEINEIFEDKIPRQTLLLKEDVENLHKQIKNLNRLKAGSK